MLERNRGARLRRNWYAKRKGKDAGKEFYPYGCWCWWCQRKRSEIKRSRTIRQSDEMLQGAIEYA